MTVFSSKPLLIAMTLVLSACSSDDNNNEPPYNKPIANDTDASLDLNRGDYICYRMATSMGDIELAVDTHFAPDTATNFQQYVDDNFYDGLIIHRVEKNFVIQGGGFTTDMVQKETRAPVELESRNGLKNYRGRIAMARTFQPNSATSQFYINLGDNHGLNYTSVDNPGYTVFGGVISGMDVVDDIAAVAVENDINAGLRNVPTTQITIDSVFNIGCP